jgi:hypothetical protein
MTEAFKNFINTIPPEYKYLLKHRIIVIPIKTFYNKYESNKTQLINSIINGQNAEINSMHKYSTVCPISEKDCIELNDHIYPFIREFYELFWMKYPSYYTSFGIHYNNSQKSLALHKDDSLYTINMCLQNSSENNEVVFEINNKQIPVDMKEDMMLIHLGSMPHSTNSITDGSRTNIIMWFK